jgi:hypothetical protein
LIYFDVWLWIVDQVKDKNRDALVFLVDCNPTMSTPDKKGQSFLEHVIRLISNVIKNRIISASTDFLGVCFYNTKKKDNSNGFAGVNIYHKLDQPVCLYHNYIALFH